MIFESLMDSVERGELLLVDGGFCNWHLRRDGQLTIREIWLNQPGRWDQVEAAAAFFRLLLDAPIPRIALENPRGWVMKLVRMPDQTIEPFMFGEPYTKATCLWLKALPPLMATNVVVNPFVNWTKYKKGAHSSKARSVTFEGIALAMAKQWGDYQGIQ